MSVAFDAMASAQYWRIDRCREFLTRERRHAPFCTRCFDCRICCCDPDVSTGSGAGTRTWVSGVGDDVNPCSRTAPCKTFAGAISKTAAGGEINVLDPGGYGTVTITKSMTLNCGLTLGSILGMGSPGVTIKAGANDRVTLRGLQFQGLN